MEHAKTDLSNDEIFCEFKNKFQQIKAFSGSFKEENQCAKITSIFYEQKMAKETSITTMIPGKKKEKCIWKICQQTEQRIFKEGF